MNPSLLVFLIISLLKFSFLKTPSSVYCRNRKPVKQMPVTKQEFSYSQEVISKDGIQYIRVSY
jgi:hypothetical protein